MTYRFSVIILWASDTGDRRRNLQRVTNQRRFSLRRGRPLIPRSAC
jgi:hypothetical protein